MVCIPRQKLYYEWGQQLYINFLSHWISRMVLKSPPELCTIEFNDSAYSKLWICVFLLFPYKSYGYHGRRIFPLLGSDGHGRGEYHDGGGGRSSSVSFERLPLLRSARSLSWPHHPPPLSSHNFFFQIRWHGRQPPAEQSNDVINSKKKWTPWISSVSFQGSPESRRLESRIQHLSFVWSAWHQYCNAKTSKAPGSVLIPSESLMMSKYTTDMFERTSQLVLHQHHGSTTPRHGFCRGSQAYFLACIWSGTVLFTIIATHSCWPSVMQFIYGNPAS